MTDINLSESELTEEFTDELTDELTDEELLAINGGGPWGDLAHAVGDFLDSHGW
jgi:hypothetical protein